MTANTFLNVSVDTIYESISSYAVAGKAGENAYDKLRDQAAMSRRVYPEPSEAVADFEKDCRAAEDEFMAVNYGSDPAAKHGAGPKVGEWKYRTYLPRAYSTAKSALAKALAADIDPAGKGKTELDKVRAEKTSKSRSPDERIDAALTTLINALNELSGSDADAARARIRERLAL